MEWQQLIYFKCVADTGSMGKASEILHVTQPAISMSIKKMEEELGTPLFTRHKKTIILNKYGRAYLKRVQTVIRELDEGAKEIHNMLEREKNHITVMFPEFFMTPQFMQELYKNSPDIIIDNQQIDYSVVQSNLIDGSLDMCLLSPPITAADLVSIPIEVQEIVAVTSTGHKLAGTPEISLYDLREERFATYPDGSVPAMLFHGICEDAGFTPNIRFQSNSVRDILTPVRAGQAIAALSWNSIVCYNTEGLSIIRLKERPQTVFALTYNKYNEKQHLLNAIKTSVINCYQSPTV